MSEAFVPPTVTYNVMAVFKQEYDKLFAKYPDIAEQTSWQAAWSGLTLLESEGDISDEVLAVLTEEQFRRLVESLCIGYVARHYRKLAVELRDKSVAGRNALLAETAPEACCVIDGIHACVRQHDCTKGHPVKNDVQVLGLDLGGAESKKTMALLLQLLQMGEASDASRP